LSANHNIQAVARDLRSYRGLKDTDFFNSRQWKLQAHYNRQDTSTSPAEPGYIFGLRISVKTIQPDEKKPCTRNIIVSTPVQKYQSNVHDEAPHGQKPRCLCRLKGPRPLIYPAPSKPSTIQNCPHHSPIPDISHHAFTDALSLYLQTPSATPTTKPL
jgi:hypothetical protein